MNQTNGQYKDSLGKAICQPSASPSDVAPGGGSDPAGNPLSGGAESNTLPAPRPFYLRSRFKDVHRAFTSHKDMPFFYRGRAHERTNQYFFIDVWDARHKKIIRGVIAAREEIFSDEPIGGGR